MLLQNALDWASKPLVDGPAPMQGKPVALCGSGGGLGTERAQLALRQTAVFMQLNVMTLPEVRCLEGQPCMSGSGLTCHIVRVCGRHWCAGGAEMCLTLPVT